MRYQLGHALALVLVVLLAESTGSVPGLLLWSGWLFIGGTLAFSGSLYVLALSGIRRWGAVAPLGGIAMLAGWATLFAYALSR